MLHFLHQFDILLIGKVIPACIWPLTPFLKPSNSCITRSGVSQSETLSQFLAQSNKHEVFEICHVVYSEVNRLLSHFTQVLLKYNLATCQDNSQSEHFKLRVYNPEFRRRPLPELMFHVIFHEFVFGLIILSIFMILVI